LLKVTLGCSTVVVPVAGVVGMLSPLRMAVFLSSPPVALVVGDDTCTLNDALGASVPTVQCSDWVGGVP